MQDFFLEGELLKTHCMILRKFLVFKEKIVQNTIIKYELFINK